ncbi:MAG: CAP domain-containing protein [Pyrinomonadaceae bacterium]
MKHQAVRFSLNQFVNFAVIIFAFSLSISAQFSGVAYVAKSSDENLRPRVIEPEKKPAVTVLKAAFSSIELEKQAFALLNSQRAEKGFPALVWNDDIARIARMHSENMAKYKFFSHTGLDGSMVNDRADKCGVSKWQAIGENIAYNRGYDKPADFAVERWMQSVSHRENILNDRWQESAVGVAISNDGAFYFTQVFLVRK